MMTRSSSKTVVFNHPFELKGVDRVLPPGNYRVVTDEETHPGTFVSGLPSHCNYDFCAAGHL